jgi:hypothetical protein
MLTDPLDVWHNVELTDEEHATAHARKAKVDRGGGRGIAHKLVEAEEEHWRGYEKPEKPSKAKAKKVKAAESKAKKKPAPRKPVKSKAKPKKVKP